MGCARFVIGMAVAASVAPASLGQSVERAPTPERVATAPISLRDIVLSIDDDTRRAGAPVIVRLQSTGAVHMALAINTAALDEAPLRSTHLPDVLAFLAWSPGIGSTSGGTPPTRLDADPVFGFDDPFPYAIAIAGFDIVQQPVRSGWDLGLGNVGTLEPLFASYFTENPGAIVAWAWATIGEPDTVPSLSAQTTPFNSLPRTLQSANFTGDFEPYHLTVLGAPFIGDGAVGWSVVGTTQRDCNLNGVPDALDISGGSSSDLNLDEIPDECQGFAFNFDFSTAAGQPGLTSEGPFGQPGFWMAPPLPSTPGIRSPLLNLGGNVTGTTVEAVLHGSASVSVAFGTAPGATPEFAPLVHDGFRISLPGANDEVELIFRDLTPGDYLVVPISVDPQNPAGEDTTFRLGSGPDRTVTGAWPGAFAADQTHANLVAVNTTGQFSLFIASDDSTAWLNGLQVVPRPFVDTNGNFIDDVDEIALQNALDLDRNGSLDSAQVIWGLIQMNWIDTVGTATPNTNLFLLEGIVPMAPDAPIRFVNAMVDDEWVIQNQPIVQLRLEGAPEAISIPFSLGLNGVPVAVVEVWVDFSVEPIDLPPPVYIPSPFAVDALTSVGLGLDFVDPPTPWVFPGATPALDLGAGVPGAGFSIARRRQIPGVSEDLLECAPGAMARSLAWMNDSYFLADESKSNAQTLLDQLKAPEHMNTSPATGTNWAKSVTGARSWISDMGLDSKLTVEHINGVSLAVGRPSLTLPGDDVRIPTPDDIANGLNHGYDVVVAIGFYNASDERTGGHVVTAVALSERTDGAGQALGHTLIFRHDGGSSAQGDGLPDSVPDRTCLEQRPDGFWGATRYGVGRSKVERVITVCPFLLEHVNGASVWVDSTILPPLLGAAGGGATPGPSERGELLQGARRVVDIAESLDGRVQQELGGQTATIAAASSLASSARQARGLLEAWDQGPTPATAQAVVDEIQGPFAEAVDALQRAFDCNANGIDDAFDNGSRFARAAACCPGDLNQDGQVNGADLGLLLGAWNGAGLADLNADGFVSGADLGLLLGAWGPCP